MFLPRFYFFFRTKPRSKSSLNDCTLDPQNDTLDFIDENLGQLEENYCEENHEENEKRKKVLDFTAIANAKLSSNL